MSSASFSKSCCPMCPMLLNLFSSSFLWQNCTASSSFSSSVFWGLEEAACAQLEEETGHKSETRQASERLSQDTYHTADSGFRTAAVRYPLSISNEEQVKASRVQCGDLFDHFFVLLQHIGDLKMNWLLLREGLCLLPGKHTWFRRNEHDRSSDLDP